MLALKEFQLRCKSTKIVGVIGQSKVDKSTLIRYINLLESPEKFYYNGNGWQKYHFALKESSAIK
ncbi:hypothetical protein [Coxiella-like endosymbiont]|uniref:hypothetical protein n=1 Tax=Coxiella-like endosymbiont TaxID=1592897 RepID=UPI000CAE026E|nr:hypothetical protein [Coxiella-like endosymbiont]PMB54316.1 hypothetical protein CLERM_177 [Coxiella-like endosymbiont]